MIPFTCHLDWEINCQFAGLVWSQTTDLYRDAGLDVRLVPPSEQHSLSVLDRVWRTPLSVGCMEDNLIVRACTQGYAIKAIGAMLQGTPIVLMTSSHGGLRALGDLVGCRVGMHADGEHLLSAVLALHGVNTAEVEVVVGDWTLNDLVSGRLDAAQGYAITEPAYLEAMRFEPHLIPIEHRRLRPYAQMMFATDRVIDEHRETLSRFVSATFAGWEAALEQPARAANFVAASSTEHNDAKSNTAIISRMGPLVRGEPPVQKLGVLEKARWQSNLATYASCAMVAYAPELAEVLDDQFVR